MNSSGRSLLFHVGAIDGGHSQEGKYVYWWLITDNSCRIDGNLNISTYQNIDWYITWPYCHEIVYPNEKVPLKQLKQILVQSASMVLNLHFRDVFSCASWVTGLWLWLEWKRVCVCVLELNKYTRLKLGLLIQTHSSLGECVLFPACICHSAVDSNAGHRAAGHGQQPWPADDTHHGRKRPWGKGRQSVAVSSFFFLSCAIELIPKSFSWCWLLNRYL